MEEDGLIHHNFPPRSFEDIHDKVINEWRVFCTTVHNNPSKSIKLGSSIVVDKYGVGRPNMWTHYATHRGICLLFNGKKLDKNIQDELNGKGYKIRHGFVEYDYDKSKEFLTYKEEPTPETVRTFVIEMYKEYFLRKSTEWRYEHEFRWLIYAENISEIKVTIEGALEAVVVGEDFPQIYNPTLINLCKGLGAKPGRIEWVSGYPTFRFLEETS